MPSSNVSSTTSVPTGIDAGQVDERLDDDRIHAAPRVVAHLGKHLRRRRAARSDTTRRDVAASKPSAIATILLNMLSVPRADRARVAGEVALHVMLVRDDHRAIRQLLLPAHLEQREHAEPRMRRDQPPFVVGEAAPACSARSSGTRDLPMS